jgi:hypothetical protein
VLGEAAAGWYQAFTDIGTLRYRESVNRPFVVYLLARLTAWLEKGTGCGEQAHHLLTRLSDQRPYEVEHLFTKRAGAYPAADTGDEDFQKLRSRLGALVLLNGSENASLGGLLLSEKVNAYRAHNWLAASLHPASYGRGMVKFRTFIEDQGLKGRFRAYRDGEPIQAFIDERGRLYQAIAERVWDPGALRLRLPTSDPVAKPGETGRRTRTRHNVSLLDLLRSSLILADESLIGRRKGKEHRATLLADGHIRTASGGRFSTPSRAAMDAVDSDSENGWTFWHVERTGEALTNVRARFRSAL